MSTSQRYCSPHIQTVQTSSPHHISNAALRKPLIRSPPHTTYPCRRACVASRLRPNTWTNKLQRQSPMNRSRYSNNERWLNDSRREAQNITMKILVFVAKSYERWDMIELLSGTLFVFMIWVKRVRFDGLLITSINLQWISSNNSISAFRVGAHRDLRAVLLMSFGREACSDLWLRLCWRMTYSFISDARSRRVLRLRDGLPYWLLILVFNTGAFSYRLCRLGSVSCVMISFVSCSFMLSCNIPLSGCWYGYDSVLHQYLVSNMLILAFWGYGIPGSLDCFWLILWWNIVWRTLVVLQCGRRALFIYCQYAPYLFYSLLWNVYSQSPT